MMASKTVLIIGSAPDAVRANEFERDLFHSIVAINNAWKIRSDWTHGIYPDDLAEDRKPLPMKGQRSVTSAEYVPANNSFGGIVYAGATMAFTAGYWALEVFKPDQMAFIGCDMIYDGEGDTHFYGEGTADPLRDDPTLQILEAKANRLMALAYKNGCRCLNLSDKTRSRLTFPRARSNSLPDGDIPVFDDTAIKRALNMEQQANQYFPNGDYWNGPRPLNRDALRAIDEQWLKVIAS
jgi:hypothetical protein